MEQEEYIEYLVAFLCEKGLYQEFEEYLKSKGFTQEEIDDV